MHTPKDQEMLTLMNAESRTFNTVAFLSVDIVLNRFHTNGRIVVVHRLGVSGLKVFFLGWQSVALTWPRGFPGAGGWFPRHRGVPQDG